MSVCQRVARTAIAACDSPVQPASAASTRRSAARWAFATLSAYPNVCAPDSDIALGRNVKILRILHVGTLPMCTPAAEATPDPPCANATAPHGGCATLKWTGSQPCVMHETRARQRPGCRRTGVGSGPPGEAARTGVVLGKFGSHPRLRGSPRRPPGAPVSAYPRSSRKSSLRPSREGGARS